MLPLYILPARGGSKGIPRKNIRSLGGRPLLAYTVEVALADAARTGGAVVLSTDDEEIAAAGRSLGLTVDYMRPASLGGDTVGSREVMLDVMDWADARGIDYDCVVLLQPTSPMRTLADLEGAEALYTSDCDMVTTLTPSDANPYYNIFELDAEGYMKVCCGDGLYTRRQDCPPVFEQNGAVYVINPESLRAMPMGSFGRRIPYIMPASRSIDLDTLADWERAEALIGKNRL
ncbi:MAG: acylneuraminate cytidylyltransferase family protein [Muribaculaceae bacterium]|nr:acylneuraminate cytidylyltransferase family protein [Muribaculaceae bacterium]